MGAAFHSDNQILRFTTAGSVDDGKSTLIGRLLYDSKSIFEDQMESLERSSDITGGGTINLANLTDGLRAEREQGITIDVAYRYFSTPQRGFIIADTPGHEQYTRNMVTGASTANLAIVLIDARNGVVIQSKRHASIASLLQIPHVLVAINKMDLVEYKEDVFNSIKDEFSAYATNLDLGDIKFIPISALEGDNVVNASEKMSWYTGPTLLHHLETVEIAEDRNLTDFRFPVQNVIRPDLDFRGFAGQIASGVVKPGDEVMCLPSKTTTKIQRIYTYDGDLDEAFAPMSVCLLTEDEIDISRGSMLVPVDNLPTVSDQFSASLCWMHEEPLSKSKKYYLKHTTQSVQCMIQEVEYRTKMSTQEEIQADELKLNEIGKVKIKTSKPIFFDSYKGHRQTGSIIIIDAATNATVAAGMIE